MKMILFPGKVAKHLKLELSAWIKLAVRAWPDSPLGHKIRWRYWGKLVNLQGDGSVGRMADIVDPALTAIGRNFICSDYTVVNASDSPGIYIGNQVMLGPRVYIRAANHNIESTEIPINEQGHRYGNIHYQTKNYSIVIEDDVWVGANSIILPGVKIGKGSVIGAGSVVTKEIPPYSVAVGTPARVVRTR